MLTSEMDASLTNSWVVTLSRASVSVVARISVRRCGQSCESSLQETGGGLTKFVIELCVDG